MKSIASDALGLPPLLLSTARSVCFEQGQQGQQQVEIETKHAASASSAFLLGQGSVSFDQYSGLSGYACDYDAVGYDDSMYHSLGIERAPFFHRAVRERRADYLVGRYCARQALAALGRTSARVSIGVMREPLWPEGIVGSITHTRRFALSIVAEAARYACVGVDAEEVDTIKAHAAEFNLVADDEERHLLVSQLENESLAFTAAFCVKESFFKAAAPSVGRYFDFRDVRISSIDSKSGSVSLRVVTELNGVFHAGRHATANLYEVGQGLLVATVAVST